MTYYLKGFIPVISINNSLNPQRTQSFVRKLSRLNFFNVKGYALVVDLQDQVPVQVDKIVELLKNIKKEKNLPIYGFTTSCCSPCRHWFLSRILLFTFGVRSDLYFTHNYLYLLTPDQSIYLFRSAQHIEAEKAIFRFSIKSFGKLCRCILFTQHHALWQWKIDWCSSQTT